MSVHYKFKSALEYDTVTFDGLHISVKDLKNAIIQQKRIGKNTDFDLQVTNAQTKEVYEDENALIPKNTSLLIARIPTAAQTKSKQWEGYGGDSTPPTKLDEGGPIAKAVDLSSLDAPEDDKIKAMMSQSTQDYDPSNYMKIRGANQMGAVPPNYRCYKCHQTGHWIKDCPLSKGPEPIEIKKSTGIPLSFMVPVEGPQVQGAMMTPNGSYAVPVLDHQTYTQKQTPQAPIQELKPEIPEDLLCSICSDLLTDAVMIPCCGNSFCDECIRSFLLESEEHECPDCHEKDISPATLIPNRFLRNSVANFKNTTGYVKKLRTHEIKEIQEEKTIISEADSTEHAKEEKEVSPECVPPGVSPAESPKTQISKRRERSKFRRDEQPQHHRNHRDSPYRNEERPGTPTVDEPGVSTYPQPYTAPPMISMVTPIQGPPPVYTNPANFAPAPNFRLPPPYLPPGPYQVPPRPLFDTTTRPPLSGPPPIYQNYSSSRSRDYMNERRLRGRTPSGVIDDPLAAFNRMLREKDERERRAKRRRSYSRSRSRSYSRSPRRIRSRTPRRRQSRSRSRSFSISRSRSRSFGSLRGSPFRDFSPPARRRGPSRYRSPPRHRFKEASFREHERDRDYERGYSRDRNRDYYDYEDRRGRQVQHRGPSQQQAQLQQDYYQPEIQPYQSATNRKQNQLSRGRCGKYSSRDYQAYQNKESTRRYDDVPPPPGVEEPPIPGLEPATNRFEERFPSPKREEKSKERKKSERSRSPEQRKQQQTTRSPSRKSKSKEKDNLDKQQQQQHKKKKHESTTTSTTIEKKTNSDDEKKKAKERKKKKEKKHDDKKKRKEKKEKHKDKKHVKENEDEKEKTPEISMNEKQKTDDDNVEKQIVENLNKIEEKQQEVEQVEEKMIEEIVNETTKDEDSEKDILEIHPTDIDLKNEIDSSRNEMLAQLPEKSKWEVEEDVTGNTSPKENNVKQDSKDKSGKVTNEVLKRAENAIFAKAINAIRPIEIKKISTDRAKLYSGEKEDEEVVAAAAASATDPIATTTTTTTVKNDDKKKDQQAPIRLSVKERLGVKIDDDRIVKVDRNKSKSVSPFTRRVHETNRNYGLGERRVEIVERRRRDRSRDRRSSRDYFSRRRRDESKRKRENDEKKKKRSRSRSEERRRKSKKMKKDKKEEEEKVVEKKKTTIDEANFEPDYDLESEKSEEKSTSDSSSESSSDDEKKKKKHKKHRKKKRRESSESSTESETESSDDDKKRKKHKKKQKKKKRAKYK